MIKFRKPFGWIKKKIYSRDRFIKEIRQRRILRFRIARFLSKSEHTDLRWTFQRIRYTSFTTDLRQPRRRKESGHRNPARIPRGWSSSARKHLLPSERGGLSLDKRFPKHRGTRPRTTPPGVEGNKWPQGRAHAHAHTHTSPLLIGAASPPNRYIDRVYNKSNVIVHVNSRACAPWEESVLQQGVAVGHGCPSIRLSCSSVRLDVITENPLLSSFCSSWNGDIGFLAWLVERGRGCTGVWSYADNVECAASWRRLEINSAIGSYCN